MNFGLRSIRRRQRSLTRGVLALFCAAWLQAAFVPCVMAHAGTAVAPSASALYHGHDAHGANQGHQHAATTDEHVAAGTNHSCVYCPPGDAACDGRGDCAYPHDPQVDARAAGAIFAAMPVAFVAPAPGARLLASRADVWVPDVVPRVSLSLSYCRFIE